MDKISIEGIELNPLKIIPGDKGDVLHALKNHESSFHGFGEAYFSTVNYRQIKGWKKHSKMTLNIIVPLGEILFVIYDLREKSNTYDQYQEIRLSKSNYARLTVSPGLWMAFAGLGQQENLLLNIASIPHDPQEAENQPLESAIFNYQFFQQP